ncbi:polyamine aminopropyltransferase [Chondromyces crocatus]|uniref:Polyamine aminopropyltransferase n=1 Tax=Chondromyces crocatus TaxID=52 RepID=A0A0K1EFF7_CHOCO|nr:polyamine aminopropyltransferase [Chondromyces crocatus]AKT39574.1 spermidine synthase [Chondromyces crocatus]
MTANEASLTPAPGPMDTSDDAPQGAAAGPPRRAARAALLVSVFVIATSGLVYELITGTLASYVLGDSVAQFSFVIGLYLFAMGIGSYLSQYLESHLLERFVEIELGIAIAGGLSAPLLFKVYTAAGAFKVLLYGLVLLIGTLVGLEIPLLIRLLKFSLDLKQLVARVLTLDYIGALVASLLFPSLLLPRLGIHQTSLFFGVLNAAIAFGSTFLFPIARPSRIRLRALCLLTLVTLSGAFVFVSRFIERAEATYFGAPVVYAAQSPYQRVVLTQSPRTTRLFLNGNLQFSSDDEYRYHEVLVHPAVAALGRSPRRVLILGGGDGLAARELLRYPSVEHIVLVDLDATVTDAFRTLPIATRLNSGALTDRRITIRNEDAYKYLEGSTDVFDLAVVDFPDPGNYAVGKLYTDAFYLLLRERIGVRGLAVVQATSPQYARQSFWTVVTTMEAAGFTTAPLHVYVPSFGEWGFVLAGGEGLAAPGMLGIDAGSLRYLDSAGLPELFRFPRDLGRVDAPINRLNDQKLVAIYTREWASWSR